MTVTLSRDPLSRGEVNAVARGMEKVSVASGVPEGMEPGRRLVDDAVARGKVVYGITTGFGALASVVIDPADAEELQHAIVRSHAAGWGSPVADEVVRAMMLLRARTLAAGHAGARPVLVEAIAEFLNQGIHPIVPEHGSVGASGDLQPLAHCALALIGEGDVTLNGRRMSASHALAEASLEPLRLSAKEGLALVNGTEGMLALLALALDDLLTVLVTADVVCAMSVEALLATDRAFAAAIHELRPHPGQASSAENLRTLLEGSPIVASHRDSSHAVQDAYSLRCAPQVHGACRDAFGYAEKVAEIELGSEVDNPVVLHESGAVESAGNFHGEPLAFALDFLAVAASEIASISERRTDRMLDPAHSQGLPPFLAPKAGVNSGFMLAQYTQAALVAENKRLAVPASVESIPTSGTTEDHVSMGWDAGLKARRAIANTATVLAIEALCAAQALDLRKPLIPSKAAASVRSLIRESISMMEVDRPLAPDIEKAAELVSRGGVARAAQSAAGALR